MHRYNYNCAKNLIISFLNHLFRKTKKIYAIPIAKGNVINIENQNKEATHITIKQKNMSQIADTICSHCLCATSIIISSTSNHTQA